MNGGTVIENVGKWGLWSVLALGVVAGVLAVAVDPGWWWAELVLVPLVLLGVWDLVQTRHSILRNFPILGHFRFLIEGVGSEMHQYLVESIRKFPDQETFAALIRGAGFERVSYRNLTGGVAAIHSGWRL